MPKVGAEVEKIYAQFRVLEHAIEDGTVKVFAHLTNSAGSTLKGAAGDVVEVADDLGERVIYVLHPLLVAVNDEAKKLVEEAKRLVGDVADPPAEPRVAATSTDGGGDTAPSNPEEA